MYVQYIHHRFLFEQHERKFYSGKSSYGLQGEHILCMVEVHTVSAPVQCRPLPKCELCGMHITRSASQHRTSQTCLEGQALTKWRDKERKKWLIVGWLLIFQYNSTVQGFQ
jgi:hypothetical protein